MSPLLISILGGLAVLIIGNWLGFGSSTRVTIHGAGKVRKTGKWIMIVSWIVIFTGLAWGGKDTPIKGQIAPGYGLAILGGFMYIIGRFIAWFQRS